MPFTEPPPPGAFPTASAQDWAYRQMKALAQMAQLDTEQTFTATQHFAAGTVSPGPILLTAGYAALIDVQKVSRNNVDSRSGGGNAAIYVQHSVDDSQALVNNVNVGIRVQMQSYQTAALNVGVNDVVGGYFGLYNHGINSGGFGVHTDSYHVSTGANATTYGMSAEMFRATSDGFTAAFHARSIGSGVYGQDNDYAFLASPGGDGSRKFRSIFMGGAPQTGTMICDIGLDLRFADVILAGIYMLDEIPIVWGDNTATHTRRLLASNAEGKLKYIVNGNTVFSVDDNGQITSGSASGGALNSILLNDLSPIIWQDAQGNQRVLVATSLGEFRFTLNGAIIFSIEDSGRIKFNPALIFPGAGSATGTYLTIAFMDGSVYKIPLYNF